MKVPQQIIKCRFCNTKATLLFAQHPYASYECNNGCGNDNYDENRYEFKINLGTFYYLNETFIFHEGEKEYELNILYSLNSNIKSISIIDYDNQNDVIVLESSKDISSFDDVKNFLKYFIL